MSKELNVQLFLLFINKLSESKNYFWGIEYRSDTVGKMGIVQRDIQHNSDENINAILEGLKGATDVIVILSSIIINIFSNNVVYKITLLMNKMKDVGKGNLKISIDADLESQDEIQQMGVSFNKMVDDFRDIIIKSSKASDELSKKNEMLNDSFKQLSEAATQISQAMLQVSNVSAEEANETDNVLKQVDKLSHVIAGITQCINEMYDLCLDAEKGSKSELDTINVLVEGTSNTIEG